MAATIPSVEPKATIQWPSGSGAPLGVAVRAELTVTFIGLKLGLLTGAGPELCGELQFDDLQGDARLLAQAPNVALRLDPANLPRLAARSPVAHKGQFGHLLTVFQLLHQVVGLHDEQMGNGAQGESGIPAQALQGFGPGPQRWAIQRPGPMHKTPTRARRRGPAVPAMGPDFGRSGSCVSWRPFFHALAAQAKGTDSTSAIVSHYKQK